MLGFPTGSGLPSITQITFSACCAHYPGGSAWCLSVAAFGALPRRVLPSPRWPSRNERPVGIHIFSFEACSSYHSRYGLQSCSPTLRGLCHEAPTRPVTPPSRSSATKAYRQLLGWVLPPLVICAIEAHVRFAIFGFEGICKWVRLGSLAEFVLGVYPFENRAESVCRRP
jgi:hypothetical protein